MNEFDDIFSGTFRGRDAAGSFMIRCNGYDVDETGSKDDAGRKDNRK